MKHRHLTITLSACLLAVKFTGSRAQSVCIDSILIDGSIKKYMQYSDFIRTGVKIDSIIDAGPDDYSFEADSIIYVGGSMFFLDSRKRCAASSIWFDKISSVQLGKYVVNSSTTYTDLRKMFPMGCAETKPCSPVRFKETILETCQVDVTDSKGQLWEMKIIFYLKDDKLIGVNFWEPD